MILSFFKVVVSERKYFLDKYHSPTNLNRAPARKVLKRSVKQVNLYFVLKSM